MRNILYAISVITLLGATNETFAADCDPSVQTLADCRRQVANQLSEQAGATAEVTSLAADQIPEVRRDLRVATTGDTALNVLGTSVSLNDLLPLLNLTVDPVASSDEAQSASLAIEYSPDRETLKGDFKFGLIAKTPKVSDAARQAIDDANVVSEVESRYDYTDDIELALTYSYSGNIGSRRVGRSDEFYTDLLNGMLRAADDAATPGGDPIAVRTYFGRLFSNIVSRYPEDRSGDIQLAIENKTINELAEFLTQETVKVLHDDRQQAEPSAELAVRPADDQPLAATFSTCQSLLDDLGMEPAGEEVHTMTHNHSVCIRDGIIEAIEAGVPPSVRRTAAYNQFLTGNGFYKLAPLINNQPQLLLIGTAQRRDELAGGNSYGAKLSFEFDLSGHNLNNLDRYLRRQGCANDAIGGQLTMTVYEKCSRKIGEYTNNNPVETGGWRGSVNVEYVRRDSAVVSLPGSMTPFALEGGRSLIGSFVAGRQFQLLEKSNLPKGKLDVSVSYEDVSGDPARQSRALGTVVFTQQLAKATQLSVGLVWANKPEFRGDVDQEITARIGLSYKFADIGKNE